MSAGPGESPRLGIRRDTACTTESPHIERLFVCTMALSRTTSTTCVGGGAAKIPCTWKASRAQRTPGEVPERMTLSLASDAGLSTGSLAKVVPGVAQSAIDAVHERPDWDSYFLDGTIWVASRADCRRRQAGAIIVDADARIIATGYNGAPAGDLGCLAGACPRGLLSYEEIAEFSDYDSGPGLCISIHAEANACLYAGSRAIGGTIYVTGEPCRRCFVTIRGARLGRLVYRMPDGEVIVKDKASGTL